MITLILAVLFGLGFAYFATQNTTPVTIGLGDYATTIPTYVLVLGALIFGIFIAALLGMINQFSSALAIFDKNHQLKKTEAQVEDLKDQIAMLEIENDKLRSTNGEIVAENVHEHIENTKLKTKSFMDRLRHTFS